MPHDLVADDGQQHDDDTDQDFGSADVWEHGACRSLAHRADRQAPFNIGDLVLPQPMPPRRSERPFDDPDWLFEPKWDGFRALAYIDSHCCSGWRVRPVRPEPALGS